MGHLLIVPKQQMYGQEMRNTLWFGGNDAIMDNAQALCDAIHDAWDDNIKQYLVGAWSLYGFDVYDKTIPSVPGIGFVPTAGTLQGTLAGEGMATQIALLVTFKAQVAPPNTNRKYLAGWGEELLANGLFTSTYTAAATAWADDILDIATTTSLAVVMEVVTLLQDGTVSGGNPLEYALAKNVPATQRRRRIGVGI
jgi:hypothetical protein